MLLVMLTYVMGVMAEKYCQFMYTKRMFQWGVDTYSYYDMIRTIVCNIGTFIIIPIFHFFNVNDNIIILCSLSSTISSTLVRALAKTETIFLSSTLLGALGFIQSAPIRAQISRCVSPEELGKVFAMLASTESVVPIIASNVFTNLYNATSDLLYPWQATFYFVEAAITSLGVVKNQIWIVQYFVHWFCFLGVILTVFVLVSLRFKQIPAEKENEAIEDKNNVNQEIAPTPKLQIIYESYSKNTGFYTTHI